MPIEWAYNRDQSGFLTPVQKGKFAIRSQDLATAYYESGPFSFFHRSHILSEKPVTDENFISVVLDNQKAIDIDEPEDLLLAEALYWGRCVMKTPALKDKLKAGEDPQI